MTLFKNKDPMEERETEQAPSDISPVCFACHQWYVAETTCILCDILVP